MCQSNSPTLCCVFVHACVYVCACGGGGGGGGGGVCAYVCV